MNLDFSDDQKFLQEEARKFLEKEQALNRNRSVLETDNKFDEDLWEKIVELGWTGIRIPEDYGGLGLGHLELCVIAEELGRFLAPVPYSSSVYLFTEAIINYGTDEIKKNILPKLVSGEIVGTLGVTEELHAPTKDNINLVYANGKIKYEGEYKNGKQIETWKYYNKRGKMTTEEVYYTCDEDCSKRPITDCCRNEGKVKKSKDFK